VSIHKPDPRGLLRAAEHLGYVPSEVLYVGDSVIDAEAAQRGGMSFVAVLSGVTPREAFKGYGTVAVINTLNELPVVLAK
jgi:phosphoglycolate phosphatase